MNQYHLFAQITKIDPLSREDLIEKVREILGPDLHDMIDTHNTQSVIFIYNEGLEKVLLKCEFGGNTATHNEIAWYKNVGLQQVNPGVLLLKAYRHHKFALLLLEFIEGAHTIDVLAGSESHDKQELVGDFILKAVNFNQQLFTNTSQTVSSNEADQFLVYKYDRRRKEAQKIDYLDRLFSERYVIINGDTYLGPDYAVEKIRSNPRIHRLLTPNKLGFIHGDLHCGNILAKGSDLYFIDPNGSPLLPFEYDLGKILHSTHGLYGAIMKRKYRLTHETTRSYMYDVETHDTYSKATKRIENSLGDEVYIRSLYAEALHFATMLPHHASNHKETLALYLRCVQLFDELFRMLGVKSEARTSIASRAGAPKIP